MRVLLAIDDSPISVRAAHEAARLFPAPDTEFFAINVARVVVPWAIGPEPFGFVYAMEGQAWDKLTSGLDDDTLNDRLDEAGVEDAELLHGRGDPVERICSAAETHDVDVIVIGAHDKGALRRLMEPSVSDGVIRGTYRPVLVVSGDVPEDATS